jgi:hypothetical protein
MKCYSTTATTCRASQQYLNLPHLTSSVGLFRTSFWVHSLLFITTKGVANEKKYAKSNLFTTGKMPRFLSLQSYVTGNLKDISHFN